jgi:hypothetical protein
MSPLLQAGNRLPSLFSILLLAAWPMTAHAGPGVVGTASGLTVTTSVVQLGPTPLAAISPSGGSEQDQVSNLNQPGLASAATVTVGADGAVVGATASAAASAHV